VSPVKYELGFYIPEDGILHSHSRENLNRVYATVAFTSGCETPALPLIPPALHYQLLFNS
jgi:hypothetical protein